MARAALVVVDQDEGARAVVEQELRDRYARHYDVISLDSADEALAHIEGLAAAGEQVALVLAALALEGTSGADLLDRIRHIYPHAKRGLLIEWGEWGQAPTGAAIFAGIAHGSLDHYLLRPAEPGDELFHNAISGLLLDWADAQRTSPYTVNVVGESWDGRAYELRHALGRCALPHRFCLADSDEGRELVAKAPVGSRLPLLVFPDGNVLVDPTNAEMAVASGSWVNPAQTDHDLVIVGAGPGGLSAAVYGASEGFSTLVVDEGGIGGQATSSSLIRNYLGFPRGLSGRRLARNAYEQAWVFGASFAFMQTATGLSREGDRLVLTLSDADPVTARAVVLATGATYRRLGIPELEDLNGAGVFYGGPTAEAPTVAGEDVYVLGGANSAAQAAIYLASYARRVTLVVRAQSLAAGMSHYLVKQVEATPNLHVRLRTEIVGGGGDGWLDWLVLRDRTSDTEERVDADHLFLMIGARPHTDWMPPEVERNDRGFVLTGTDLGAGSAWPLERNPFLLETGMPGVFAVGDIRHGSVNRVASAVGEGSVAIQMLHRLFADERLHPRGRTREPASAP